MWSWHPFQYCLLPSSAESAVWSPASPHTESQDLQQMTIFHLRPIKLPRESGWFPFQASAENPALQPGSCQNRYGLLKPGDLPSRNHKHNKHDFELCPEITSNSKFHLLSNQLQLPSRLLRNDYFDKILHPLALGGEEIRK